MNSSHVDIAIFGCEYRTNTVVETCNSFSTASEFSFRNKVLCWDGDIPSAITQKISPDYVVRSTSREGYVPSIVRWLRFTDSEYFFWLEDDWTFVESVNVDKMVSFLERNNQCIQVRLSKRPLRPDERVCEIEPGIYRSEPTEGVEFSANPCLCRTKYVQLGMFNALEEYPEANFESAMTSWAREENLICAVIDPGSTVPIQHTGYLEYTDKYRWHSVQPNTDGIEASSEDLAHFGFQDVPLQSRLWMVVKLLWKFLSVSIKQFYNNRSYKLAMRICHVRDDEN